MTLSIDNLIQQWKTICGKNWSRGKIEKSFPPKLTDYFIQWMRKKHLHCNIILRRREDSKVNWPISAR